MFDDPTKEFIFETMAIVELDSWHKLLSPESEFPPDVFFLVKGDDEIMENVAGKQIAAHKIFLTGVSPVFMSMLCGPLKEEGEVIEVRGTTAEAFTTMINYIYKAPGPFFNQNRIHCPQKLFELLEIAERFEILSMKRELISDVLESLTITMSNVIFVATIATEYRRIFDEVSIKLLTKCLKILLKQIEGGDTWTSFWTLVNNGKEVPPMKERLDGTPFARLNILIPDHRMIKHRLDSLDEGGSTLYEECLRLACSGVHVR